MITSEPVHPHEIIEFSPSGHSRIIEKCVPLYEKGYSLTEVSQMTGVPQSSIFTVMKRQKIRRRSLSKTAGTNPPFGYTWLGNELVMDPKEYKTVKKILDLSKAGMRPYHIEKLLNESGTPTRKGGKWFARVITGIIEKERDRTLKSKGETY